ELDAQGHIVSLVEKPKAPKSELALVGIYLLRKNIFPIIKAQKPSWRNELEITEALDELRKQGGRIRAAIVKGWWKDTGKPMDIGDPRIDGPAKIMNSLIGRSVTIRSAGNRLPKGHRLIVGENSTLDL